MSVAFTKEDSAETAAETVLPDRLISPHLNLVTQAGLKALEQQLQLARQACEAANAIEDINERRRLSASPLRDMRYFAERVRTAQLMPDPPADGIVAFGSMVTFSRDDGRTQRFRIVGEDEADPASGTMSYVSPVARVMMGKTAGDLVNLAGREIEIIEVA
ncbi:MULTISPECIES: transcription elongation factor GreA [Agrobacterium]|uniref:Transcription elongation factor GreA n=1 Tax=Agrobacterium tumefaciens TaxID=358 RepID=A0AAE6BFV8_AGRTU|nr:MULTISPECIES: transcription elongation factor GreA [Agrobacterium]QCL75484.1 transcription elongation factor GreA [Agrobacterium tumefaciens]QCL81046.1 transcription elongation factor GreA [Agrobacterium tumefaciens]